MDKKDINDPAQQRESRFIWQKDDIVIIKSANQLKGKKGKPASLESPPSGDTTASETPQGDDEHQG